MCVKRYEECDRRPLKSNKVDECMKIKAKKSESEFTQNTRNVRDVLRKSGGNGK